MSRRFELLTRCSKTPSPLACTAQAAHVIAMRWLFQPLLLLIAKSTESQLAAQVEFLKAENRLLRKRLPKTIPLFEWERMLLVRLGGRVGSGVKALISVVSYHTYLAWRRRLSREKLDD